MLDATDVAGAPIEFIGEGGRQPGNVEHQWATAVIEEVVAFTKRLE